MPGESRRGHARGRHTLTEARATFWDDEFNWCIELAERLRQGQWDEADRDGLIRHLEDFVAARLDDVTDASRLLLKALLEATTEPGVPPAWRQLGVMVPQRRLRELLRLWPGLLPTASDLFAGSYRTGRKFASVATGKPEDAFPRECPWTLAEALAVKWPRLPPSS